MILEKTQIAPEIDGEVLDYGNATPVKAPIYPEPETGVYIPPESTSTTKQIVQTLLAVHPDEEIFQSMGLNAATSPQVIPEQIKPLEFTPDLAQPSIVQQASVLDEPMPSVVSEPEPEMTVTQPIVKTVAIKKLGLLDRITNYIYNLIYK
jgi:hypothetical protein